MNGEGADGNLFESAKNKARAIVKAYGTDDQFQILSNDFEGRHQRLVNQSDALTWIDELTISPSSVTLSKVLQRQKQALEKAGTQTKISYLISDFQEHICDVASIPEDTGTLLYFIPVKAGASHNISIDSAWFTNPVIQLNKPVTLNVRIRNYSEAAIENVPITLSLDGRQKGLQNISCKAFDYEDISFSFTPSRGMQNGEISILDHPVTFDDKLFFHFTPVNQYNVLCINGTLPNTFIQKVFESDPSYILRQISQNQISYSTFREQQLIILNEPQELSSGLLQELKKYIEEGGQLLIIPPSSTSHNLNVLLTQLQLPALGQLQKQSFKLSTINTQDMLFKDVFQKLPQNMDLPAINQYYELERTNSTIGRELMELPNGSPFAWQGSLKKGNVVVLATPLQLSWSSFPQHAIFVPFMLKLGTGKPEREALYYTIGEAEWIPYRQTAASEKLVTLKGNGQEYKRV
jgi:hypothetical protein